MKSTENVLKENTFLERMYSIHIKLIRVQRMCYKRTRFLRECIPYASNWLEYRECVTREHVS